MKLCLVVRTDTHANGVRDAYSTPVICLNLWWADIASELEYIYTFFEFCESAHIFWFWFTVPTCVNALTLNIRAASVVVVLAERLPHRLCRFAPVGAGSKPADVPPFLPLRTILSKLISLVDYNLRDVSKINREYILVLLLSSSPPSHM